MKPLLLIVLIVAGCAASNPNPKSALITFPDCPDLLPTPSPIGKKETVTAFEIRIELSREESVKRHAACWLAAFKMREWIEQHK